MKIVKTNPKSYIVKLNIPSEETECLLSHNATYGFCRFVGMKKGKSLFGYEVEIPDFEEDIQEVVVLQILFVDNNRAVAEIIKKSDFEKENCYG